MAVLHRNEISEAVERIGLLKAEEKFESFCIIPMPQETKQYDVISLTSVHMLPGSPKPRLHKLTTLPTPFEREIREASTAACVDPVRQEIAGIHNKAIGQLCGSILSTCEDIDARESPEDKPFRILGVLGVYQVEETTPFSFIFADRAFTQELATNLSAVPTVSEVPEENKRQFHTRQAELSTAVLPYNEWIEQLPDATMAPEAEDPEDRALAVAQAVVRMLVLPREATHPIFNVKLF